MKCFLFHDWSNWRLYHEHYKKYLPKYGALGDCVDTRQVRRCNRCGKAQDLFVHNGETPLHEKDGVK